MTQCDVYNTRCAIIGNMASDNKILKLNYIVA